MGPRSSRAQITAPPDRLRHLNSCIAHRGPKEDAAACRGLRWWRTGRVGPQFRGGHLALVCVQPRECGDACPRGVVVTAPCSPHGRRRVGCRKPSGRGSCPRVGAVASPSSSRSASARCVCGRVDQPTPCQGADAMPPHQALHPPEADRSFLRAHGWKHPRRAIPPMTFVMDSPNGVEALP